MGNTDMMSKVNRLNELFSKQENGINLTSQELTEQSVLRDELINYLQFAIRNSENNASK